MILLTGCGKAIKLRSPERAWHDLASLVPATNALPSDTPLPRMAKRCAGKHAAAQRRRHRSLQATDQSRHQDEWRCMHGLLTHPISWENMHAVTIHTRAKWASGKALAARSAQCDSTVSAVRILMNTCERGCLRLRFPPRRRLGALFCRPSPESFDGQIRAPESIGSSYRPSF